MLLARACGFCYPTEFSKQYTEFLLCAYNTEDKEKKKICVYLQGGLIGKTDIYANNYHTATCLLGVPDFDNNLCLVPFLPRKFLNTGFIGSSKMSRWKRFRDKNLERRDRLDVALDGCM